MSKVPYSKSFLSYTAQLSLLKSRGMVFADEEKALHLLEKIGYYRLSGYWYPLLADKEKHTFKSGANYRTYTIRFVLNKYFIILTRILRNKRRFEEKNKSFIR
jgi:abortive infection bacteriophage resistance protein